MSERDLLYGNHIQIIKTFNLNFPNIVKIARASKSADDFKEQLKSILINLEYSNSGKDTLLELIEHNGKTIYELSNGENIQVNTITYLWSILSGNPINGITTALLIDLYHIFEQAFNLTKELPIKKSLNSAMERWPSGLNRDVISIRASNKERIATLLIKKVEQKHSSKFNFEPGISSSQKYQQILKWWDSSSFHLAMAIKDPIELNLYLNNTLPQEVMESLITAKKRGIPFFITPYYASLLNTSAIGYDDQSIRSYILYSKELIDTFGSIRAWEKEDIIIPGEPNAAGWILPNGHNIHRRYPEVAILIPDTIGRACGGICASCQRMYGFQSKQLNFDFDALKPKESWDKKLQQLMNFFEEDSQLCDILITGGDALMSVNKSLSKILDAVYKMALKKREISREMELNGKRYATMQRVRLGSRLLAYLPQRVDDELISILKDFKEKGAKAGITQFVIQTHFQSPLEVTPEAINAINAITNAGWIITNQLVFNVASSRRGHTAKLRRVLNRAGVLCYYTFSVKGFNENYAVFTPNSRSMQEAIEEKSVGYLNSQQENSLYKTLFNHNNSSIRLNKSGKNYNSLGNKIDSFLKENSIPFAATDRNVLNLPAIGKSMSFKTIGITKEGKRILQFQHDSGRNHSPIIENMGNIYITENKSIASYLKQLKEMGENIKEYSSIWSYTTGETEPRFKFFEYQS